MNLSLVVAFRLLGVGLVADLAVTPAELRHAAAELSVVAEELRAGMTSLDTDVVGVVGASWSGGASSAFGVVWRDWHEGAGAILEGLAAMSALLDHAAGSYTGTDGAGAAAIDGAGL